ncbi:MAG: hypothetical protein MJ202_02940 [Lentisphaeria bacterium]|nr:hypothetical protein [Lentisphaeria bacterium]
MKCSENKYSLYLKNANAWRENCPPGRPMLVVFLLKATVKNRKAITAVPQFQRLRKNADEIELKAA